MFNDSKLEMSPRTDVNGHEAYVVEEVEDYENQPTKDVLTNAGFYDNRRPTADVIKVIVINFLKFCMDLIDGPFELRNQSNYRLFTTL